MNFREFVKSAEEHLIERGWYRVLHNGVWPSFKQGPGEAWPFPTAIATEMAVNSVFNPIVEEYLLSNGWRRCSGVTASWPVFAKGNTVKPLRQAMIEQLRIHRLSREDVVPRTTPSDMKKLIDPKTLRKYVTPPAR